MIRRVTYIYGMHQIAGDTALAVRCADTKLELPSMCDRIEI
jgi:hypothetical protein